MKLIAFILAFFLMSFNICSGETVKIKGGTVKLSGPGNYKLIPEIGDVDQVRRINGLQKEEMAILSVVDGNMTIFILNDDYFIMLQKRCDFELNHENDRIIFESIGEERVIEIGRSSGGN